MARLGGKVGAKSRAELAHELCTAALVGDVERVRDLLSAGANVDSQRVGIGSALSHAAYNGHPEVVRLLVQSGANVNLRSGVADWSALHNAARGLNEGPANEAAKLDIVTFLWSTGLIVVH